jgi:peptidyl-prolyl cis-trans isomerase D
LAQEQAELDRERAVNELMTRAVDQVYKNPNNLDGVASETGLEVRKLGPVTRASSEGVLANPAVKRAAFDEVRIQDGTISDPIELAPGHSVLVRVAGHTPESARPLDQVRDDVAAAIRADRAREAAKARAEALLARLRGGETLDALAEAEEQPAPQPMPGVMRGMPIPDIAVNQAMFATAVPQDGKPTPGMALLDDGSVVLFTIDAVTPGDIATISAEERRMLEDQLRQVAGMEDVKAYTTGLRKGMDVTVFEENL